jgi:hypothetical protein
MRDVVALEIALAIALRDFTGSGYLCKDTHDGKSRWTLALVEASRQMSGVRKASVVRKTNETDIQVSLTLDSSPGVAQNITVSTGIGFLDHVCPP